MGTTLPRNKMCNSGEDGEKHSSPVFILKNMAHISKTTLYPNLWELCSFIAEVIGIGVKRAVYDNHKTFFECGYMPCIHDASKTFSATSVVKNLIVKAQERKLLPIFRVPNKPLNRISFMKNHSNESYLESAEDLIKYYLHFVRTHKRKKVLDARDMGVVYYNVELRMKKACENAWFGEKWNQYESEVISEYLEWCEEQAARKNFIDVVVWFLGDSFRKKCESHYEERFQKTEFRYNDVKGVLDKDFKEWSVEDKKKAFAVPFCGENPDNRNELYSLIFEKITREYKNLSNSGRKHPNLIIDQYTELGYVFGWQCRPAISGEAKQVLRVESDDKDLNNLSSKLNLLKIPKEVYDLQETDVFKSVKDDLEEKIKVKGMRDLFRSNIALIMGNIPENLAKQNPVTEINQLLDELESGSPKGKFGWQIMSRQFPIFGATGYICEKKWKPYIPYLRRMATKSRFMVLIKFGIHVLNVLSKFRKIPEVFGK